MLMKQNVNNDVAKDSPIAAASLFEPERRGSRSKGACAKCTHKQKHRVAAKCSKIQQMNEKRAPSLDLKVLFVSSGA